MIKYVRGDATSPSADGAKIIAHICNSSGVWSRGFVLALSRRWSRPESCYGEWFKYRRRQSVLHNPTKGSFLLATDSFKLGEIQLVQVLPDTYVANMIAQEGYGEDGRPPVRYDALDSCLRKLDGMVVTCPTALANATIHMPRIGCGLGGGEWSQVEPLIDRRLNQVPVYVYDLAGDPRGTSALNGGLPG